MTEGEEDSFIKGAQYLVKGNSVSGEEK